MVHARSRLLPAGGHPFGGRRHDSTACDSRSRAAMKAMRGSGVVTRFAPSPTGRLHLGHAFSSISAHDAARAGGGRFLLRIERSEEHTSELQSIMRISYAVSCLKKTHIKYMLMYNTRV